jgi:transcriptional regulator with XRE-family HTH domain
MNKNWPQQEAFCQRVKEFCDRNGYVTARGAIKLETVASLFNLTRATLKHFLQYKSRNRPHYDTLAFIASIIGCSVTEFMDNPSGAPIGMQERWIGMTERERMFASRLITDFSSADFSPAEKEALFSAYQDMKALIVRLRKAQATR